jgi:glycosyltransferase involved in cell wall biosynthesis
MKRVLIVCAHRPDRSPSQRYRFEQYIPFLESHGFQFTWSPLLTEEEDRLFYAPGHAFRKAVLLGRTLIRRVRDCSRFRHFDIVFIQREASFLGTAFAERRAYRSGAKVIFDFDDSIWLADTSPANKKWEWIKRPSKFFDNVANAHLVIAGNAYLAEQAKKKNRNVIVIPTTVDTALHVPIPGLRENDVVTIGWSGSISTVKHFETLLPVLRKIHEKYGEKVRFRLLGAAGYSTEQIPLASVAWSAATEVRELNRFDIGVMPLPVDSWSEGKCGLKALTYMACGIPAVVSPVGVNTEIVREGSGFVAATPDEWFAILCRLIEDRELRKVTGLKGRGRVEKDYSVSAWKERYLQAFGSVS